MYDGSIRINTRIDGKGFDTGVKGMMSSLGRLAATIGAVFGVRQIVNFGKEGVKTAMQMEAGWQGLSYMANAYGRDIGHISDFLKEFTEDGLVPMMNAQQAYKNMLARGYDTDQLEQMLLVMKDSSVYLRKGQLDIGEAIEKTTMGLRTERSILTDSSGIEQNMYKMWQAYAKEIGVTISSLTKEQKIMAEYQGFMREGAIYAGAAAEYTQTYAGRVAQLTAAMIDLKVSVGNMLIPILNQLLPKIIELVRWFTRLFNIVGRVMNLLFGTNVGAVDTQPIEDGAEAYGELGDAAEEAGKAAKGALAPFDKLNVLAQPKAAGGGGGGIGDLMPPEEDITTPFEEELDELGVKIDAFKEKLLAFFAPLKEPFERLKEAFSTLGTTIVTGLGWAWDNVLFPFITWVVQSVSPVALDIISGALDVLNEILIAVSPLFIALWEDILKPMGEWAGDAFVQALTWIAEKLTEISTWISENKELVQNIATVIGIFAAAWILVNTAIGVWNVIGVIATGVTTAFGAAVAFLTSPIGIAVLAVAALIAVVLLLRENWDKVKEVAESVWDKIVEIWQPAGEWFKTHIQEPLLEVWDHIKEKLGGLKDWFEEKVIAPLKEKFGGLVDKWGEFADAIKDNIIDPMVSWFQDTLYPAIQTVLVWIGTAFDIAFALWRGQFTGVFDAIVGIIRGALEIIGSVIGAIIDVIAGIITFLTGVFTGDWDRAWQGIKDVFTGIWEGMEGVLKGVINAIIGLVNGMISGIVAGINNVANVLNGLQVIIPDWVPFFGGNTFSLNLPNFTAPQIPYLATGAVIPANAPFAAILGDQRAGTNIEAPESLIRRIVREETQGAGAMSGKISFDVDESGLMRYLHPKFQAETWRVGSSLARKAGAA